MHFENGPVSSGRSCAQPTSSEVTAPSREILIGAPELRASPTAIVIDDMPEMAQFLCDLCRACGLDSRRFADSREVDPARLRDAAVVFLDLTLPGLDGVVCRRPGGWRGSGWHDPLLNTRVFPHRPRRPESPAVARPPPAVE